MVAIVAVVVGGILGLAFLAPRHMSDQADYAALGTMIVSIMAGAFAYGQLIGPPTGRLGWLRRHYPAVAEVIKRYRKSSDLLEAYTPALVIEGKRYFLIAYHDRRNPQPVAGFLLLDEAGGRVVDEELLARAAKCKTLALETIEYARHQRRAAEIHSFGQAKSTLKGVLATLRRQRWRFAEMGAEVLADWERVTAIEPAMEVALDASAAIKVLESEWAAKHGLGRLTEVRYEEVLGLEARITEAKRPLLEHVNDLEAAAVSAERLTEKVQKMSLLADQKQVEEGLLALMDLGKGMVEEQSRPYSYVRMSDQQWQAWRDRMAYADEVDARLGQKAGA
jgi:hypothetical protein